METRDWVKGVLADLIQAPEPGSRPPGGATADSGEVPSIGGENIDTAGRMSFKELKRVPRDFYTSMRRGHLRACDVLINKDGAQTGKVAMYRGEFTEAAVNEHVFILRGRHEVLDQAFLFHCLVFEPTQEQIARTITGSAQPGINSRFACYVRVSYPRALPEQRRIAEILDTVDEVIQKTEQVIAKLKMMKQGLLSDLLTRGIDENGQLRDPERRPTQPISDLAAVNPSPTVRLLHPNTLVSFIPMSDVSDAGEWIGKQTRRYSQVSLGYTQFEEGDVLFAKITPCMENGKGLHAVGLVSGLGFGSTEFHVLRAKPGHEPRFVFHWLQNPALRRRAEGFMIGSAGQQRVQPDFFDSYRVPVLPVGDEPRVARVLDAHDARIRAEEAYLAKMKMLKQGLMHDLLTGKVRVRTEEPARDGGSGVKTGGANG